MLKSVMFFVVTLSTLLRLADLTFLLFRGAHNLPTVVVLLTGLLILIGLFLIGKKLIGNIQLRHLIVYFLLATIFVGFNLIYIALTLPLELSLAEMLMVGTVPDLLINVILLYYAAKEIRNRYIEVETSSPTIGEKK